MRLKAIIPSLAFVFGVAATGCESDADIARKPGLVDSLVARSIETSDTGRFVDGGIPYSQRLRSVLMECNTKDLAVFKDHDIALVLDQRLGSQKNGLLDRRMDAIFYNDGDGAGAVSLWDDGTGEHFMGTDLTDYNPGALEKLAGHIRDNEVDGAIGIAGRYKSGKHSYTTRWKSAEDFDGDTRRKNEAILNKSPRRRTRQGPGGQW